MKTALLLVAIMVSPLVAADTYVHVLTAPDFQYRSDQSVGVPFQVNFVRNDVPQPDAVSVEVTQRNGQPFQVFNAESMKRGVAPYPETNYLNFGELEPGLYELTVTAKAGGITKKTGLDFSVVLPPIGYFATIQGSKEATFFFEPNSPDPSEVFTIRLTRPGVTGAILLDEIKEWNSTEIKVPYVANQPVTVEVEGPNGWMNQGNKQTDFITGQTSYPPVIWFPDVDKTENAKRGGWLPATITVAGLAIIATGHIIARRNGF